ncbi:MAG: DUF4837 family protein [Paludibacteraceae bacterium]|nr:DUF4837 family protein [Paludibacteraceae bacterium]
MKKFITNILSLLLYTSTPLLLIGCADTRTGKVSATGAIYECLVVSSESVYDVVKPVMEADMPCLPQMESYFKVMHVVPSQFDSYLQPTRNILIVDIDSTKYTTLKVKVGRDLWSHPQAVYRIQSPNRADFDAYWEANSESVREWFVNEELQRQTRFYRASTNKDARHILQRDFHCDLLIPEDYILIMDTTLHSTLSTTLNSKLSTLNYRLIWCCNNKGPMRRDLVIYSYPYTDQRTFTLDYLCQKRDEVLGQVVTASVEGSYMGTEYRIFPPQYKVLATGDRRQETGEYTAELRGLWKIYGGEAMGGPFVSHTVLDESRQQVITAEVFLYAAGQKKRNALRQAEAILYTLTLQPEKE